MPKPEEVEEHLDHAKPKAKSASRTLKVKQEDMEWAAKEGLLTPPQAKQLWEALMQRKAAASQFDLPHLFWYAGAVLIFLAMGWLAAEIQYRYGPSAMLATSIVYLTMFLYVGTDLWTKQAFKLPSSLLFILAALMVPIICYSFVDTFHYSNALAVLAISVTYLVAFLYAGGVLWFQENLKLAGGLLVTGAVIMLPIAVDALDRTLNQPLLTALGNHGFAFLMQGLLIVPAVVLLLFFKSPLLTTVIAFALCWMSDTTANSLFESSKTLFNVWNAQMTIMMLFGLGMVCLGFILDGIRRGPDYAFWFYLFGVSLFWGALSSQPLPTELSKFIYFLINLGLIFTSVIVSRVIFLICGSLGVLHYLGYLLRDFFSNPILFAFALILIGLSMIWAGVNYYKNKAKIDSFLRSLLPTTLRNRFHK